MWGLRVWWARTRVHAESGDKWSLSFHDTAGTRQDYGIRWDNVERVALLCENTPPGEPAAIYYFRDDKGRQAPWGVDLIDPVLVPTVGRLARQAWESYQRSKGAYNRA